MEGCRGAVAVHEHQVPALGGEESVFRYRVWVPIAVPADVAQRGQVIRSLPRVDKGNSRIEPTTWHPRFGASESNLCIVLSLDNGQGVMRFFWD